MTQILPPKKDVALALLERASVFVHLDPRGAGVVVPMNFKKQPRLVLQIGLNMHVPIPDLRLDEQGLSCTLSFNRTPFHCIVPWPGVFALVGEDGRGMVWPEDVPQEIAREMTPPRSDAPAVSAAPPIADGKKKPHVALVSPPRQRPRKSGGPNQKRKREDGDKRALVAVPKAPPSAPAGAGAPRGAGPEVVAMLNRAGKGEASAKSDSESATRKSDADAVYDKYVQDKNAHDKHAHGKQDRDASDRGAADARDHAGEPSARDKDSERDADKDAGDRSEGSKAPAAARPSAQASPDRIRADGSHKHGARPHAGALLPPSRPPAPRGKKGAPKKELPPYLRVVK